MGEEISAGKNDNESDPGHQPAVTQCHIQQPAVSRVHGGKDTVKQGIKFAMFLFDFEKTRT